MNEENIKDPEKRFKEELEIPYRQLVYLTIAIGGIILSCDMFFADFNWDAVIRLVIFGAVSFFYLTKKEAGVVQLKQKDYSAFLIYSTVLLFVPLFPLFQNSNAKTNPFLVSSYIVLSRISLVITMKFLNSIIIETFRAKYFKERDEMIEFGYRIQREREKHFDIVIPFETISILYCDISGILDYYRAQLEQEVDEGISVILDQLLADFDKLAYNNKIELRKENSKYYYIYRELLEKKTYTHLYKLTSMAMDMMKSIERINQQYNFHFQLKMGMATGQYIDCIKTEYRGIVKLNKKIFDRAQEMEFYSLNGKINVDEETMTQLDKLYYFSIKNTKITPAGKSAQPITINTYLIDSKK